MTTTPHCDRFLRDVRPTHLTTEGRKRVHHLLHAVAVDYTDVLKPLRMAVEGMRKLSERGEFLWSQYVVTCDVNAAQVVWAVARAGCLLPAHPPSDRPRFRLYSAEHLLAAIDDTVSLWRSGKLVEDTVTTKDAEPAKDAEPWLDTIPGYGREQHAKALRAIRSPHVTLDEQIAKAAQHIADLLAARAIKPI